MDTPGTGSSGGTLEAEVMKSLRAHKPVKVRALVDGEWRAVAIPGRRRRWEAVLAVLDKLAWTRLELLDKGDGLLDAIETDAPDKAAPEPGSYAIEHLPREHAWLDLVLKAQAQSSQAANQLVGMVTGLVETMTNYARASEERMASFWGEVDELRAELAAANAGGAEGDGLPHDLAAKAIERFMGGGQARRRQPANGAAKSKE